MGAIVDIVYRSEWDDGFGARGWKLAPTIGDPRVIATTAFIGKLSDTSVFVHDVVDHHLCGLGIGGHRNEAVAVFLHALRSGVPTYLSMSVMVEELMLTGYCGENLEDFLPKEMIAGIRRRDKTSKTIIKDVIRRHGSSEVYNHLVEHYHMIGASGVAPALTSWSSHGLHIAARPAIGKRLQKIIESADEQVLAREYSIAYGRLQVDNDTFALTVNCESTTKLAPMRIAIDHNAEHALIEVGE